MIWNNGVPSIIGTIPPAASPADINDNGQILAQGGYVPLRGYVGSDSSGWRDIGVFDPNHWVTAISMNNKNWVVGFEYSVGETPTTITPFLWKNGQLISGQSLVPAGSPAKLYMLLAINNHDQIVCNDLGSHHIYVLTPAVAAAPTITSVSPTLAPQSAADVILTVYGTNFEDDTTVILGNGVGLPTHVLSANKLTVAVPANAISQLGMVGVKVYTPPAGGGYSNSLSITVVRRPALTSIAPSRVDPGGAKTPIYFTGSDFEPGDFVTINDQYTVPANVASDTKLAVFLPDAVRMNAGLYFVRVVNPHGNFSSNPVRLTIGRSAPVIGSLSPSRIPVGLTSLSLYVNGVGIVAGSQVTINNGAPITPTSTQANRLVISVPPAVLARLGTYQVRIVNSVADGGPSAPANFEIVSRPVLTSIIPASFPASSPSYKLTLVGSGFEPGVAVMVNNVTITPNASSPTKLVVFLPPSIASVPGSYGVKVVNPGYANVSGTQRLTVTAK